MGRIYVMLQLHSTADTGTLPSDHTGKLPPPSHQGLASATCHMCCWRSTPGPACQWTQGGGAPRPTAIHRSESKGE